MQLFEKYLYKFLEGVIFNSCAVKNHINYFEEKFQIDINHKMASILMNFPKYDLKIIDFLTKNLKQKNSIVPLFINIFVLFYCY